MTFRSIRNSGCVKCLFQIPSDSDIYRREEKTNEIDSKCNERSDYKFINEDEWRERTCYQYRWRSERTELWSGSKTMSSDTSTYETSDFSIWLWKKQVWLACLL